MKGKRQFIEIIETRTLHIDPQIYREYFDSKETNQEMFDMLNNDNGQFLDLIDRTGAITEKSEFSKPRFIWISPDQ